jgi:two-component system NarL family sensor kinase
VRRDTGPADPAAAESERLVAWLRIPAVALIAIGESIDTSASGGSAFFIAIAVFGAWSLGLLAWLYARRVTQTFAVVTTAADVGAITTLALLSGGGFSQARFAYFLVPVAVAFRFRPLLVAGAGAAVVVAYIIQAVTHETRGRVDADRFIAVQAGYLLWIAAACTLLALVLARRTRRVTQLAAAGQHLLVDALGAEERERQALAEALHDHAIQNLLLARHELQEVADACDHPAVERASTAVDETVDELRETVSELHPLVLEQAGLEAALSAAATHASTRGGFHVHMEYTAPQHHPHERVLLAAARELLANVARHAGAANVTLTCREADDAIVLVVADDGVGFDSEALSTAVARGHIGLASQRTRVEGTGGTLTIHSQPGAGTVATIRVPRGAPQPFDPGAGLVFPLAARDGGGS